MEAIRKVLVVDDDPVIGKSFERVLSGHGYAVISATDGQEALDRLAREDYDVVYTDIKMPGMSGLEVAERIGARKPWLPVVIITGYGSDANEARAKAAGVAGFLRKPLSPEMIESSAHKVLLRKETIAAAPAATQAPASEPGAARGVAVFAKNVGLFIAAPLIALVYVIALPFVGFGVLVWQGFRALAKRDESK